MLDKIQMQMLTEVADLHGVPEGAYNIRVNGEKAGRNTTANIDIVTKTDGKSGIGIKNVNDRLKIWFGDAYGITIESEPDCGTRVMVRMPKKQKE